MGNLKEILQRNYASRIDNGGEASRIAGSATIVRTTVGLIRS